jgi:hypothetical protein
VSLPTVQEPVELSRRIAAPSQIECEEAVRPRVEEMLNLARRGQHVLTRREILRFITAEAGTRAQEIQALLNLTPIENVRRALVTVRNDFRELMETARSSHASTLAWDPAVADLPYSVVINRMSPSSWLRGHGSTVQSTAHYLVYLESIGVPVINGSQAGLRDLEGPPAQAAQRTRHYAPQGAGHQQAHRGGWRGRGPHVSGHRETERGRVGGGHRLVRVP